MIFLRMLNAICLSTRSKSFLLLGTVLFATIVTALFFGAYHLDVDQVMSVLFVGHDISKVHEFIIFNVRFPRVVLGVLVGAGLSVSGAALQGLFRNPLASPSLIGVTSGAMLAAVASIVLINRNFIILPEWAQAILMFVVATLGGWGITLLVYRIATQKGQTSIASMLLAGIAISALAGACTGLITYFSDEDELRNITFWTLGSLASASWMNIAILGTIIIITITALLQFSKSMDIMALGEQEAYYIGVNVQRIKSRVIILAALIVGPCVAITGIIGFVALVIPHLMRSLGLGKNHRQLIINSALGGAILLVSADTFARTLIAPSELPIGVLTALIGGPYFLWLLIQQQQRI